MARTQQSIDTPVAKAARLDLARLEAERGQAHGGQGEEIGTVPTRSLRRATSRRASKRRAEARTLKADTGTRIVEFVTKHPGSTAGEVAKGLDLNRSSVSNRLTQLAKLGHIRKADRGYAAR
jgi:hypothetical protein